MIHNLFRPLIVCVRRIVLMVSNTVIDGRLLANPPLLMLSEQKWAFLSNGATMCLQSVYRFKHRLDIRCLNNGPAFSGRYLVLQQARNTRMLQLILKRTWKIQIITAESKSSFTSVERTGSIFTIMIIVSNVYWYSCVCRPYALQVRLQTWSTCIIIRRLCITILPSAIKAVILNDNNGHGCREINSITWNICNEVVGNHCHEEIKQSNYKRKR